MKIVHLSDLHWGFSPERDALIEQRLGELSACTADHVVISGDLSQSGRSQEFAALRSLLLGSGCYHPDRLTVIPGNHDLFSFFFRDFNAGRDLYARWRRLPGAAASLYRYGWREYEADLDRFHSFFSETFEGIFTLAGNPAISYPFIKLLGERAALIVLESNRMLPQIRRNSACSNGWIDLDAAAAILAHPGLENRFRIVVLHHQLQAEEQVAARMGRLYAAMTRLINRTALIDLLDRSGVDLVLHGHYHHLEQYTVGRGIPVVNSGDAAGWHLIDIGEEGAGIIPRM